MSSDQSSDESEESVKVQTRRQRKHMTEVDMMIAILTVDSKFRTWHQLKFLCDKFEQNVHYFQQLRSKLNLSILIKLMATISVESQNAFNVVFNQGETGRKMYIILKGEVAVLIKTEDELQQPQQLKRRLTKTFDDLIQHRFSNYRQVACKRQYDYFGEIAIEQRIPRTATVITKEPCIFAIITFDAYQQLLSELQAENIQLRQVTIARMYPFNQLNEMQLQQILHNYEELNMQAGALLYRESQKADAMYLVIKGEVLLQVKEYVDNAQSNIVQQAHEQKYLVNFQKQLRLKNIGLYGVGQLVGDYELYLKSQIRRSTAIVKNVSRIIRIPFQQYVDVIEHTLSHKWLVRYLNEKYEIKSQQQRVEISSNTEEGKTKQLIAPQLKQMIIRMRKHHDHNKIASERYQSIQGVVVKPIQENQVTLKNQINLQDKSILKYLAKDSILPKLQTNTLSHFSVERFATAMKTRVQFNKILTQIDDDVSSCRFQSSPTMPQYSKRQTQSNFNSLVTRY